MATAEDTKVKPDEDDIVVVEDQKPKADARLSETDEDDDDAAAEGGGDSEEREQLRQERREERRLRRERRNKAMERDKGHIRALEQRLAALEGRTVQQDTRDVDARLSQAQQEFQRAEAAIIDAVKRGDGDLHVRALRVRDDAAQRARQLADVKARTNSAPSNGPDPVVARYASDWAGENSWYDPQGSDQDSIVATAIDRALAAEGLDPRSEDYWDELDERVKKALPHRFRKSGTRSSPPTGGTREHAPRSTRTEVYISPERKAAMIAAGIWDDPTRKAKAVRAYHQYDKDNAGR